MSLSVLPSFPAINSNYEKILQIRYRDRHRHRSLCLVQLEHLPHGHDAVRTDGSCPSRERRDQVYYDYHAVYHRCRCRISRPSGRVDSVRHLLLPLFPLPFLGEKGRGRQSSHDYQQLGATVQSLRSNHRKPLWFSFCLNLSYITHC